MTAPVTTKSSKQGNKNVNFRDPVAFTFEKLSSPNLRMPELDTGRALFFSKPRVP